jgi:hypothetical protein
MKICSYKLFKKFKKSNIIPLDITYFEFAFWIPVKIWFAEMIWKITGIDINA